MLSIEQQVVTREQAQELYDLGFRLDTQWYWVQCYKTRIPAWAEPKHAETKPAGWRLYSRGDFINKRKARKGSDILSAPTVAELAIILPWMVNTSSIYTLMIWRCGAGWGVDYFNDLNRPLINRWAGENLAKTMGDRVIWLAEEKILIPEETKC